ncbi:hypothetical protein OFN34_37745, partial [Escherichia coli]|nr:hypothetical protein [Escherichia coli]
MTQIHKQIVELNNGLESAQVQLQKAVLAKSNVDSRLTTHQQWLLEANSRLEDAKTEWESALKTSAFADEAH